MATLLHSFAANLSANIYEPTLSRNVCIILLCRRPYCSCAVPFSIFDLFMRADIAVFRYYRAYYFRAVWISKGDTDKVTWCNCVHVSRAFAANSLHIFTTCAHCAMHAVATLHYHFPTFNCVCAINCTPSTTIVQLWRWKWEHMRQLTSERKHSVGLDERTLGYCITSFSAHSIYDNRSAPFRGTINWKSEFYPFNSLPMA